MAASRELWAKREKSGINTTLTMKLPITIDTDSPKLRSLVTFSLLPFPVRNASIIATNIESVAIAILAGAHLGYLPQHFAERYEQRGLLRRLRQRSYSRKVVISVMTKAGRRLSVAARLFQEICIEQIRARS